MRSISRSWTDQPRGLRLWHRRAPRKRIDPRQQFRKREGLDEIIVAAGLQPLDPVVDAADRGQEKDRRLDAGSPASP